MSDKVIVNTDNKQMIFDDIIQASKFFQNNFMTLYRLLQNNLPLQRNGKKYYFDYLYTGKPITGNKRVIAFGDNDKNIIFESKKECATFFDITLNQLYNKITVGSKIVKNNITYYLDYLVEV